MSRSIVRAGSWKGFGFSRTKHSRHAVLRPVPKFPVLSLHPHKTPFTEASRPLSRQDIPITAQDSLMGLSSHGEGMAWSTLRLPKPPDSCETLRVNPRSKMQTPQTEDSFVIELPKPVVGCVASSDLHSGPRAMATLRCLFLCDYSYISST
jgi:hypothetical protein